MNTLITSKPLSSAEPSPNISYQFKSTSAYSFTNFFDGIYSSLTNNYDEKLLVWQNGYCTGRALLEKISGIRNELIHNFVSTADEVLIIAPSGEDQIAGLLATMALGAIPFLPHADSPPQELLRMIRSRRIKTVLSSQTPLLVRLISNFSYLNIIDISKVKGGEPFFPVRQVNHHQGALIGVGFNNFRESATIYQSHKQLLAEQKSHERFYPLKNKDLDLTTHPNLLLYNLYSEHRSFLPTSGSLRGRTNINEIIQVMQEPLIATLSCDLDLLNQILEHSRQQSLNFPNIQSLRIYASDVLQLTSQVKDVFSSGDLYTIIRAST